MDFVYMLSVVTFRLIVKYYLSTIITRMTLIKAIKIHFIMSIWWYYKSKIKVITCK